MKKYLVLLSVFIICSVYIFYTGYNNDSESSGKGDAPIDEEQSITLGGTVEEPKNDIVKIGEIQTAYIMYVNGDIEFDDMVRKNMTLLKDVFNYPFNPMKGYLFSVGYSDNSKTQFYYQSDQEETRTVILKVEYNENGNEVTKIYDGEYFKLVSIDEENPNQILAYDRDNDTYMMVVK